MFSEHLYQSNVVHAYFFGRVVIVFHKIDIFLPKKCIQQETKFPRQEKHFPQQEKHWNLFNEKKI